MTLPFPRKNPHLPPKPLFIGYILTPKETRILRRTVNFHADKFFTNISIEAGGIDMKTVKKVYYSMIKVLSRDLKSKYFVLMPDWCAFELRWWQTFLGGRRDRGKEFSLIIVPKMLKGPKEYFYEIGKGPHSPPKKEGMTMRTKPPAP